MPKAKKARTAMQQRTGQRGRPSERAKPAARKPQVVGVAQAVSTLRAYCAALQAQRADLDTQIQSVEQALHVMGAAPAKARPAAAPAVRPGARRAAGRGPRPGSLKEYIMNTLRGGGTLAVKDITAGVLAAGYKSQNKTLAKSVGIALTEIRGD